MNFATLYGKGKPWGERPEDSPVAEASGPPAMGQSPALFWVGMLALLVIARLAYEAAD